MLNRMATMGIIGALVLTQTCSSASAFHRSDLAEIKLIAHDLADSANIVHEAAERQAHHFSRSESRNLSALDRFASSARRFHETIESYFSSSTTVRGTLDLLNEDAALVSRTIRRSHSLENVFADWDTCTRLLDRINARMSSAPEVRVRVEGDDAENLYVHEGVRYPRNGNRYWRNDRWNPILGSPVVTTESQWYTNEGVRYDRRGNTYRRDGRWIEIPTTRKTTVRTIFQKILSNQDDD